jgi:hypothetical protein
MEKTSNKQTLKKQTLERKKNVVKKISPLGQ